MANLFVSSYEEVVRFCVRFVDIALLAHGNVSGVRNKKSRVITVAVLPVALECWLSMFFLSIN